MANGDLLRVDQNLRTQSPRGLSNYILEWLGTFLNAKESRQPLKDLHVAWFLCGTQKLLNECRVDIAVAGFKWSLGDLRRSPASRLVGRFRDYPWSKLV